MLQRILRPVLVVIAMVGCAAAGVFLPPPWHGAGGRDFRPQATTMAVPILGLAVVLRRGLRWRVLDFVLGLVAAELVTLVVIANFSGFAGWELFDRFNLSWLAGMNLFIGLPWLVGLGAGSLWLKLSHRHDRGA